jgi:demethylmenaquinone methyltransferase / 2-methoxy-6-polyprenyl-1,4-benzoquinol methylase
MAEAIGETGLQRQRALGDKQAMVDGVFRSVAHRYDLMNDLMSGGVHRAWKSALVTAVNPPKGVQSFALLDVAGGTGDVAFRVLEAAGAGSRITVLDISREMLEVGRARATDRCYRAAFVQGSGALLPFRDRTYDAVTVAFGIRNMPRIELALAEAYRVLRIGGRFFCLEFSNVDVPGFDKLYDAYSFNVIPVLGSVVTGDAEAYHYLVESIRSFPRPNVFAQVMQLAGFARVSFQLMTGGIVALHSGWRL